ncbi:hypothetical protein SLH49_03960 [Cognatiyoonia sp. IB215446]|uniref:hypothetical protein n=1 Tax=Cognatiyoonia sp. IB215446 TaxID=3097355 RepID=UPI002A184C11|nr:hypothetical protein [Cognatiyoonia sp. IB215446]MDX8347134.1 hypothetical protein [Cognatiyoonia sp. IB215446]
MLRKTTAALAAAWQRFVIWVRPDRTVLPKAISDRTARDIGLSGAELERHRFVWPSESRDRPLI